MLFPTRSSWSAVWCAVALLALAGAGTALAQEDGVHVDPDSPAGKEYALPLESARDNAAPGGGAGVPGSGGGDASGGPAAGAAPLFGAGISSKGSGGRDETSKQKSRDKNSAEGGGAEATGLPAAVADSESGLSAGLLTALIAFGVLVVGGAVGLSLRALRSPHQAS